jgi:general secretion pathway protein B
MNFETHVYSSNPNKRWVKVNGNEFIEGDWITERVRLVKIEQQSCQISFNGETIQVPALYDWKG